MLKKIFFTEGNTTIYEREIRQSFGMFKSSYFGGSEIVSVRGPSEDFPERVTASTTTTSHRIFSVHHQHEKSSRLRGRSAVAIPSAAACFMRVMPVEKASVQS